MHTQEKVNQKLLFGMKKMNKAKAKLISGFPGDGYIKRYINRNSKDKFVKLLKINWDTWIKQLSSQEGCTHLILKSNEYLSDVI